MSYRRANGLILVSIAFLLCAFVAFLLYRQNFFITLEQDIVPVAPLEKRSGQPPVSLSSPDIKSSKILKNFGSCVDESRNDVILSYSADLVNALLDNINDNHCEAPKVGFPNYSFVLLDPSQIRIAEMTPDYKSIFCIKQTLRQNKLCFLIPTQFQTIGPSKKIFTKTNLCHVNQRMQKASRIFGLLKTQRGEVISKNIWKVRSFFCKLLL